MNRKIGYYCYSGKKQGEMTKDELIEHLRSELERVKGQRNEYQMACVDSRKLYKQLKIDNNLLETYINRTEQSQPYKEFKKTNS
jgi:uncharacterized protein involved in exopolysaccharide biosynthesis